MEKRKKQIELEQAELSIPFIEQLGAGCKAVFSDGGNKYLITYNPTKKTMIKKDMLKKLKLHYPDIYEDYVSTSESRTFRITKEAA